MINWKDKLEFKYVVEEDVFQRFKTLTLFCSWRGHLLMRKVVTVRIDFFNFNAKKLLLRKWFDEYVLNYDDLTTREKYRIKNFPFVGEKFTLERKRYAKIYSYVDSEFVKYAKIKMIFVRVANGDSYRVLSKTVICELL